MRYRQSLIPTLKQDPSDAEVVSHKLMVRAGMIRQIARGIYDFLPLGLRLPGDVPPHGDRGFAQHHGVPL